MLIGLLSVSITDHIVTPFLFTYITNRHDNTGRISPGCIGASALQRQWIGLSVSGDSVTIEPVSSPAFLQDIALEVGFLKRGLEIAEQFSADEMARTFIKAFAGVMFALGEVLVFEFHGQNLRAVVKSCAVVELADGQRGGRGGSGVRDAGVVMERTDVTFMKDPSTAIKIKSSAKKWVSCVFK